ncbi:hypothetical protein [Actinomadura madurae]|uniref:hypothetical protein n=1 Tax=Actinomadura madurae TaxID=1993 RepID=UPI002026D354|nr:hypothetical protein [Actinomadura madurae]MCP9948228.1 hypothetical protein [Actinomadura madurae]MCP9977491.1 hypothetical protein [Actinomadura madurae]MCQ0011008.1 hypothetical protein [Actinomadura madurae]MCQ0013673.1 hypothetical protein [Actinomadura madurae]URM93892.1 hypothetical protein LUW76_05910 [Actinomadura madurae]
MWKPDCIAVALSTQSFTTLAGAPYLEIARLSTRRPSTAAAVVGRPDAHFDGRPVACVTIFGQRGRLCLRRSVDAVGG